MWILIHHLHIWSTCPVLTKSLHALIIHTSVQLSSVAQSCLNLCDPMGCSTPGFPVHHQLLELSQTHVHQVGGAIPTISFSAIPFSCLQSFPASGSSPVSQFFLSGGQNIGASASVLPLNIQDWFPLAIDWFDLLAVQGTLKSLLQYHSYSVINFYQNGFMLLKVFYFKCNFLLIGMLFDGIYSESRKNSYWFIVSILDYREWYANYLKHAKLLSHVWLMDCISPGPSVLGIFQARILEWVTILFFRGFSRPKEQILISYISCNGRQVLYQWYQFLGSRDYLKDPHILKILDLLYHWTICQQNQNCLSWTC